MRDLRGKTAIFSRKLQIPLCLKTPSLNPAQSVGESARWTPQMFQWSRPFLDILYGCRNKKFFSGTWQKNTSMGSGFWDLLKLPRFLTPRSFLGNLLKIEIYTDDCAMSPFGKGPISWESGICIGGTLVINGEVGEFTLDGNQLRKSPRCKKK